MAIDEFDHRKKRGTMRPPEGGALLIKCSVCGTYRVDDGETSCPGCSVRGLQPPDGG